MSTFKKWKLKAVSRSLKNKCKEVGFSSMSYSRYYQVQLPCFDSHSGHLTGEVAQKYDQFACKDVKKSLQFAF